MRQWVLMALLLVVVFGANVYATYQTFTREYGAMADFVPRWEGARTFWQEGHSPYSDVAITNIHNRFYGRPAQGLEDRVYFVYPFYIVFPMWPLVQLDYAWAMAVWMVLLEGCLVVALLLLLDLFRWRVRPLTLLGLIIWTLVNYFATRNLLLGQFAVIVYVLEMLSIWALARRQDRLAGVALALSTIKPQMGYLIVPFLLLWGLRDKRFRFVGAFVATFAGLMAASFLFLPTWLSEWVNQVLQYPQYTYVGSPLWVIANAPWASINLETRFWDVNGGYGGVIEAALTAGCVGLLLWSWWHVLIQQRSERLLWTIALTLLITHLIAPRTATTHFIVFNLPLIFYLRHLRRVSYRYGVWWMFGLLVVIFVATWGFFLATLIEHYESPLVFVPVPIVLLIALWFTRRLWWQESADLLVGKMNFNPREKLTLVAER